MSQFPNSLDTDLDLPRVDGNITEIGGDAINALRDAMFRVEGNIGLNANGTANSISDRLNVSLNPDGSIKPSILVGLVSGIGGLTDAQISQTAGIKESKLALTYSTASLFNLYTLLKSSVDVLNGFLSLTGIKLEPHIDGTDFNHLLSAIKVDLLPAVVKTNPIAIPSSGTNVVNRNSTNADTLVKDMSDDLVVHEKSDGSAGVTATGGGTVPPLNYAHMASGVFVDPSNFSTIPQVNDDVQKVINYFDTASLLLFGNRTQNLFANGVSRTVRASSLLADGYGEPVVPPTLVTTYLLNVPPGPRASSPVDDFNHGDDVVLFNPTTQQLNTFNFDAQFAQVQPGDLITINYGTGISIQFLVDSIKSSVNPVPSPPVRTYAVRLNGKNPFPDGYGIARIDRSTFHRNQFGVLATARAPNTLGNIESLIVANPKSAIVLGNGFAPNMFDSSHFNLYLTLLPSGDLSSIIQLPAIDVTGNGGTTPGKYTLSSIIDATNTAFRAPGFNYRFIAFDYKGQFGIMLADPYNNAAFSIIGGIVDTNGNYSSTTLFPNNVVDNFNLIDPLGFGITRANVATPPPAISYSNVNAAKNAPTLLFYPLKRNFYYVNGAERDTVKSDPISLDNIQDTNGFGFWPATITSVNVLPSRVQVVYTVNLDLSTSGLKIGKTLVVQPTSSSNMLNSVNYGRFLIENVAFNGCGTSMPTTNITVYDAVHGIGNSPFATAPVNSTVNLYFSDDSVSFDAENVFDTMASGPYKRFFEIYVDKFGHTQTHERARFLTSNANISNINLYRVSPKLRGYNINNDREIRLKITTYDTITGIFSGALSTSTFTNLGPTTSGKKGEIVRFYDETNIDFIDFIFNVDDNINSFTNQTIDIQLFKSLQLDQELLLTASCQLNDSTKAISYLKDERQFGNISEEQFTTSAIDFISTSDKLLRDNGIINGFDNPSFLSNKISFNGGAALVNGKIILINQSSVTIPKVVEVLSPAFTTIVNTINWFVCVNDKSEIELVASTDYALSLSSTYGSLDQNRIFYVLNQALTSPTAYSIRSSYLSDIMINRKDLMPIYFVSATTTGTITSVVTNINSMTDMRRFVSNGYGGLTDPFTFGQNAGFRSFDALNTWLTQLNNNISAQNSLNNIGKKVIVKGNNTITTPITLSYNSEVIFEGDSGMFTIAAIGTGVNVGNNVTFRNIQFNNLYDPIANSDSSYTSGLLANNAKGFIYCNVDTTNGNKNIKIDNCVFTSSLQNRFPFIVFNFSASSAFAENVSIVNNKFNTTFNANDKLSVISFVGPITISTFVNGPRLINCIVDNNSCNKDQLIMISSPLSSGIVADTIVPVNVKVTRNICGAINFLVKQDASYDSVTAINTTFSRDKNNGLLIDGNDCKYIYTGFANGSLTGILPTTTISAASDGYSLPQSTINVVSTSGFLSSGVIFVTTTSGVQMVTYTNTTGTSFTGCVGGTGTMHTGNSVVALTRAINYLGVGVFSPPVTISNNYVNWMHIGYKLPTTYTKTIPPTIVKNNSFTAYDSNFLTDYNNGFTSINTALILDKLVGS